MKGPFLLINTNKTGSHVAELNEAAINKYCLISHIWATYKMIDLVTKAFTTSVRSERVDSGHLSVAQCSEDG